MYSVVRTERWQGRTAWEAEATVTSSALGEGEGHCSPGIQSAADSTERWLSYRSYRSWHFVFQQSEQYLKIEEEYKIVEGLRG